MRLLPSLSSLGPSSGLNVAGAVWAAKALGPGHTIVTILCDPGSNYLSKLFSDGTRNAEEEDEDA